jgi:hypothetical protein
MHGAKGIQGMTRPLVPYVLLAILTVGTGLGAGLSLAWGPITYSAPTTFAEAYRVCASTPPNALGYSRLTLGSASPQASQKEIERTLLAFSQCLPDQGFGGRSFG